MAPPIGPHQVATAAEGKLASSSQRYAIALLPGATTLRPCVDVAQLSAQISPCCFVSLFLSFFRTTFVLLFRLPSLLLYTIACAPGFAQGCPIYPRWSRSGPGVYAFPISLLSPIYVVELTHFRAMIPRPPPLKRRSRHCPRKLPARKRRSTGPAPAPAASRSCWCYISVSLTSYTPLFSSSS